MRRIEAQPDTLVRTVKLHYKPLAVSVVLAAVCVVGVGTLSYFWQVPVAQVRHIQSRSSVDDKLTPKEEVEFINDFRRSFIGSIGTVATIVGGVVLFLNFKIARERLDIDIHKTNADKKLNESRLISERFSKAIEQLGSENIHIRLGGIYSLKKIAIDSLGDREAVLEVLSAFIRTESSIELFSENEKSSKVSLDVRAALNVIASRDEDHYLQLDLSCTKLNSVHVVLAYLDGANLHKTDLSFATLRMAKLGSSDLTYANLSYCELIGADLYKADLSHATLRFTQLTQELARVNFSHSILEGISLENCNLRSSDFVNVSLTEIPLIGANLTNASLVEANLQGVDLKNVNLDKARVDKANLADADLSQAKNITEEQLGKAILCRTKLPTGIELDPNRDCNKIEELE